jgi:hypothetical protein
MDAILKVVDIPPMTVRKKEGGAFEISFENRPSRSQSVTQNETTDLYDHEVTLPTDIQFYYHALGVPATEYFDLRPIKALEMKGARPAICYPKKLSQTRSLLPESRQVSGKTKSSPKGHIVKR